MQAHDSSTNTLSSSSHPLKLESIADEIPVSSTTPCDCVPLMEQPCAEGALLKMTQTDAKCVTHDPETAQDEHSIEPPCEPDGGNQEHEDEDLPSPVYKPSQKLCHLDLPTAGDHYQPTQGYYSLPALHTTVDHQIQSASGYQGLPNSPHQGGHLAQSEVPQIAPTHQPQSLQYIKPHSDIPNRYMQGDAPHPHTDVPHHGMGRRYFEAAISNPLEQQVPEGVQGKYLVSKRPPPSDQISGYEHGAMHRAPSSPTQRCSDADTDGDASRTVHGGTELDEQSWYPPLDPNLTCPACGLMFKKGEIQKFKRHYEICMQ